MREPMSPYGLNNVKDARIAAERAKRDLKTSESRLRRAVVAARKKGYSLRMIADVAGVSNVTILNWERKER